MDWNLVFHILHSWWSKLLTKNRVKKPCWLPSSRWQREASDTLKTLCCHDLKFFFLKVTLTLFVFTLSFWQCFLVSYCVRNNSASLCQYFIYFAFQCCLLHSNSFVFSTASVFVWVTDKNAVLDRDDSCSTPWQKCLFSDFVIMLWDLLLNQFTALLH